MIIAGRRFEPRAWAVVLYLLVFVAMLSLGRWQLQRADEKIALTTSAERARGLPPVELVSVDDVEAAAAEHGRVAVSGRWDGARQLLWDNRAHDGQAGFEVIAPLILDDGRIVLVNRGWIAPGASRARESLPDVRLPAGETVEVIAWLSRPSKGFASGDALPADGPWPRLLQYFDYAALGAAYGTTVIDAVLQPQIAGMNEPAGGDREANGGKNGGADGGTNGYGDADSAALAPDRTADPVIAPYLLIPNWQPAASGPEKHYGYAFQWFAMAAALTILFIVVNLSKSERS